MKFDHNGETRYYIDCPYINTMKVLRWGGELRRWCTDQFGPQGWDNGGWDADLSRFIFKNEKDYMLVLLRWGHGH